MKLKIILFEISRNIYTAYVQRFIKKKFVTVPSEEFMVIRACHNWHEQDRMNNRISIEKVITTLNQQSPTVLNRMLRRYKNGKVTEKQAILEAQNRARSHTITSPLIKSDLESPKVVVSPLLLSKNPLRNPMAVLNLGESGESEKREKET